MERRKLLGTMGSIVGTAALGGAGLITATGSASATASQEYGDVTITSDDGTVDYVAIYGGSVVEWDGFDSTATQARIVLEARVPGQVGWMQLNDTQRFRLDNDGWGGANEELSGPGTSGTIETGIGQRSNGNHDPKTDWHVVGSDPDGYDLPNNSIDPSNLEVTSDGGTENFDIDLRSTYIWYDDTNAEIFRKQFSSTVDVEVNNEEASASSSSDGESGAVGG